MTGPVPYQRHSLTSQEAAERAEVGAPTQRAAVWSCLQRAWPKGLTDEQICEQLALNPSTERPRRIELQRLGVVRATNEVRKTRSGRRATVWVAVPEQLTLEVDS